MSFTQELQEMAKEDGVAAIKTKLGLRAINELSGGTLQAHSAARRAQGMKMDPFKQKEEMKDAFAAADKSKFRHMDAPDKVTKVDSKQYELSDTEKEDVSKKKQDSETEMKTKGYGIRGRNYGD